MTLQSCLLSSDESTQPVNTLPGAGRLLSWDHNGGLLQAGVSIREALVSVKRKEAPEIAAEVFLRLSFSGKLWGLNIRPIMPFQ